MNRRLCILLILALAVFTGCRKQVVPDVPELPEEESREMVISVRSGDVTEGNFVFLFWKKEDFDRGLRNPGEPNRPDDPGSPAEPYFIARPSGNINDYREPDATVSGPAGEKQNDYNTGRVYPENYGIAVCTGYAPCDRVSPALDNAATAERNDYTRLNVAESGDTDVLVSANHLEGSSIFPFSGNLGFFHPQIRLTVKAKLAETMAKYIRGVSFSIGGGNLLKSLEWDMGQMKYLPAERYESSWTSAVTPEYLNKSDERILGSVFVVPEQSAADHLMESIDITLAGRIANTGSEAGSEFTMTVTADLTGVAGGGLTLGDSYEILLLFDEDQIEITASKVPWEEGGNVLVPIHPIPETPPAP